ncbi:MAG: periplasmic heavy metal sensor [Paracoccaceae bacterium]
MSETTPPRPEAPKASGRGLRIALAVSVALNLAVLGVMGGALLKFRAAPPPPVRELSFGPFTDALTPEQRTELRRAFVAKNPDFRSVRREMRADTSAMLASLRADPFDPDAFSALIGRMNGRLTARTADGQEVLRDLILSMPADQRRAFADRLEMELRHDLRDPPKPRN